MSNEGARATGSAAVRPAKTKKPWKGEKRSGPAPARHIPWPEVFKHHISVVEGHMKMLEMIQKHTVEGTPNFRTISDLVDRSREMLRHAKQQSHSFVPPPNYKEAVPLGSSSESMYPGYSPAHIQYGQAAQEVGTRIGALRTEGKEWKPPADAPEYQIGQGHGQKRKFKLGREEETNGESSGSGNESAPAANGDATEDSEVPLFVVDTNPTPLVGSKRPAEETPDGAEKKKKKKKSKGEEPAPVVETEDISAEVEANLKAKEKSKDKDGKRRRSSGGSDLETKSKKSKKEKKEKKKDKEGKRSAEADIEEAAANSDGEGKKKKRKKNKESA